MSWAVPEGPSLDPTEEREAVQVRDHPLASLSREGLIPPGRYGAGWRYIWDRGVYTTPERDIAAALRDGALRFTLYGHRLNGDWRLFRALGNDASKWLLQKCEDEFARRGHVAEILGKNGPPSRKCVVSPAQLAMELA
jgi:bifunctional non-homologous end joining protein LigD